MMMIQVMMTTEETPSSSTNTVWKSKKLPKCDAPFTRGFGPNIPEDVNSLIAIFSALFIPDLVNLIVKQISTLSKNRVSKMMLQ